MGEWTRKALRRLGPSLLAVGAALTGLSCGGGDITGPTTGTLKITTAPTGPDPDLDGYTVAVDGGSAQALAVGASLTLTGLAPGDHSVELGGIVANCQVQGDNPRRTTVPAAESVTLVFVLTCSPVVIRSWTLVPSGTTALLNDVWGSAANDFFAVGEDRDPASDACKSIILHFDGASWSTMAEPAGICLQGIWGSSPRDVIAVGFQNATGVRPAILHYDGSTWREMTTPAIGESRTGALTSVWGSSASNVFAVGSLDGPSEALILHFDGATWSQVSIPADVSGWLIKVWGSGAQDVFAAGAVFEPRSWAGVVLHYDGNRWTQILRREEQTATAVWSNSATDVWASVDVPCDCNSDDGLVLHYDGAGWSEVAGYPPVLDDLWGTSPTNVYGVGGFDGKILHHGGPGTGWAAMPIAGETPPIGSDPCPERGEPCTGPGHRPRAIYGTSGRDVFVVGDAGAIFRGTP